MVICYCLCVNLCSLFVYMVLLIVKRKKIVIVIKEMLYISDFGNANSEGKRHIFLMLMAFLN